MKRRVALVLVWAACLAGCKGTLPVDIPGLTGAKLSDEESIAVVLSDVHKGLQTRHIFKVLAHVARAYHDQEGRDYDAAQVQLSEFFKKYREIRITRVRPRVLIQGNRARAIETFGATAEPVDPAGHPPLNLQGQVMVWLERIDGVWKIVGWTDLK